MSYLPPPAFLKNHKKSLYERDDTNKISPFISIETRREDGSFYMVTIRKSIITKEPDNSNFLISCFFNFPEFIYRFYNKHFRKYKDESRL